MPSATHPKPAPVIHSHVGLRGIAAMTVFLAHLGAYGIANVFNATIYERCFFWHDYAVDFFFLLSGFIMNWVYVANDTRINWRSFYSARVARIIPLYYLTQLVALLILAFSMSKHHVSFTDEAYFIKLLTNFFMVSGILSGGEGTINQPAWSIGVEMFCYLAAFPLLVRLDRFLKAKKLRLLVALAIVGIASHLEVTFYTHPDDYVLGSRQWDCASLGRGLIGFTAGFFVCSLYHFYKEARPAGLLIDGALAVAVLFFIGTRLGMIPPDYVLYSLPFFLFLTAFDTGMMARLLKTSFFRWLGERSYSIYLWQFPGSICYLYLANVLCLRQSLYAIHSGLAGMIHFMLAVGFVLGLAELSYSFFEIPLRKWIRSMGKVAKPGAKEWWDEPLHLPTP